MIGAGVALVLLESIAGHLHAIVLASWIRFEPVLSIAFSLQECSSS